MIRRYPSSRRMFLLSAAGSAVMPWSSRSAALQAFSYQNPNHGVRARDCQIVRTPDAYYLTGTFPPFWPPDKNPGVRVSRSVDLVHWTPPRLVVTPGGWYQQLFWAPEIFPYKGMFYLTF